jgi:hypothetical protein
VHHEFIDPHPMMSTTGADHDLPYHLPVRSVYLETEYVGRLVPISELEVEVTDRLGVDEGHGDLADSLEVETKGGQSSGEEAAGSFCVESVMANLIKNGDGHGRGVPQVATLSAVSTA